MTPKISIIVPIYNVEQYLAQCVDSILNQTFTDFELILVDDGSPDNCSAICDEYAEKDNRIIVIHKENGGVSSARNAGLDIAKGEYVTFCDSDDYWSANWLGNLHTEIVESNSDVINATFEFVDVNGTILQKSEHEYDSYNFIENHNKIDFIIKKILGGKIGWEIWTRVFKLNIIKDNNIRFCEKCDNFAEDLGFVMEYTLYCKSAKSVDLTGYYYVQRDNSMMHKSVTVIKLNALNEISIQFGKIYQEYFKGTKFTKLFPVFHFMIMNNQYRKMYYFNCYPYLFEEVDKIINKKWYFKQTVLLYFCYKHLSMFWGTNNAKRILLFSNYCVHRNWRRFKIESAIVYKWFIKGD